MPPGNLVHTPVAEPCCRECSAPVEREELTCPACGAARPSRDSFAGEGYEWSSKLLWMGMPLVHIAFGIDARGKVRTATGIIAIGQRARGAVAIGIIATGFLAIGVISAGLFSVGVVAVAALGAAGVNAFAPFAIGVVAFGHTVGGVAAIGWRILFSAH